MEKCIKKRKSHDPLKTWIVREVARIYGVSDTYIYLVMEGERNNESIVNSYMNIKEGATKAAMIEAVEVLVPFENLVA